MTSIQIGSASAGAGLPACPSAAAGRSRRTPRPRDRARSRRTRHPCCRWWCRSCRPAACRSPARPWRCRARPRPPASRPSGRRCADRRPARACRASPAAAEPSQADRCSRRSCAGRARMMVRPCRSWIRSTSTGSILLAAIDQHRVGGGELDRRDLVRAQRRREVGAAARLPMPKPAGDVDDLVHADLLGDAHRDQVARLLQPDPQRDRAEEVVAEVLGLAIAAGPGPGRA